MALSEDEQRLLEEIEKKLIKEEPWLELVLSRFYFSFWRRTPRGPKKPKGEKKSFTAQLTLRLPTPKIVTRGTAWWNAIPEWLRGTSLILGVFAGAIAGIVMFVRHSAATGSQFLIWELLYCAVCCSGIFAVMYTTYRICKKKNESKLWWVNLYEPGFCLAGMILLIYLIPMIPYSS